MPSFFKPHQPGFVGAKKGPKHPDKFFNNQVAISLTPPVLTQISCVIAGSGAVVCVGGGVAAVQSPIAGAGTVVVNALGNAAIVAALAGSGAVVVNATGNGTLAAVIA